MVRRRAVQSHAALAFAKVAVSFGEALQTGKQTIVQKTAAQAPAGQRVKQKKLVIVKQRA
jgi:hypothetical protein